MRWMLLGAMLLMGCGEGNPFSAESQKVSSEGGSSEGSTSEGGEQDSGTLESGTVTEAGECLGCMLHGVCVRGNSDQACGYGDGPCVDCTQRAGTSCQLPFNQEQYVCWPVDAGSEAGTQPEASTEAGTDANQGACPGCLSTGVCQSGFNNDACGHGGALCVNCLAMGQLCSSTGAGGWNCVP